MVLYIEGDLGRSLDASANYLVVNRPGTEDCLSPVEGEVGSLTSTAR